MKKNVTKVQQSATDVTTPVLRNIKKSPEQRYAKITAYLDAALYNAKKVNDKKIIDKLVNTGLCSGN
jgi:hypothetical protein